MVFGNVLFFPPTEWLELCIMLSDELHERDNFVKTKAEILE